MSRIDRDIRELKARLNEGAIQRAYQEILAYMARLRAVLAEQSGARTVSGIYQGHLDITHFALFPEAIQARDLKLTILFNYETFCFELWLTARNKKVSMRYWQLLREAGYDQWPLVKPEPGNVAIVKVVLVADASLASEESLTSEIVEKVADFERDVVAFLSEVDPL